MAATAIGLYRYTIIIIIGIGIIEQENMLNVQRKQVRKNTLQLIEVKKKMATYITRNGWQELSSCYYKELYRHIIAIIILLSSSFEEIPTRED